VGEDQVAIHLTLAEAVVLNTLLFRYERHGRLSVEDQAEQQALWNLHCLLERVVVPGPPWPSLAEARLALRAPDDE
jgi:hypothetical protein